MLILCSLSRIKASLFTSETLNLKITVQKNIPYYNKKLASTKLDFSIFLLERRNGGREGGRKKGREGGGSAEGRKGGRKKGRKDGKRKRLLFLLDKAY